jgi:phosphoglycerol transferase MdoB-like AlkP superfamily enzyme
MQFIKYEDSKTLGNNKLHPLLMSPIGYHMFDIYRFWYEKSEPLDNNDIAMINSWLEENSKYNIPAKNYEYLKGIAKGKNIIAIQFESLENIIINQSYYNSEITPNINKLLKSSIYFNNIYEQVRDGNSSDAELMFNTSIYPLNNGSTFLRFSDNNYNSLPYLLNVYGYTSIAVHGDDKEFWNRDRVFPSLGFDDYVYEENFIYKELEGMGISDESLFLQSFEELKKINDPFYLYIITLTSHMPFNISENNKFLNLPYNDYSCNYLQSIHYTDKVFGEFYKKLDENGYLDNTVLIIYGDHEGINKYYDTYLPKNYGEIPFIIHIPGIEGFEMNKIGGQVDMMPTLLYLLGIDENKYSKSVMGNNLLNNQPGYALLANGDIIGKTIFYTHITQINQISELIIKGNYFKCK